MKQGSYLKDVRNQYEDFPYPHREPENEKGALMTTKSSSLDCLNFYCFEGKRDFNDNFRVLVPGGGTGDCAIYLAEQLRDTSAEVVYLDMSTASMAVAKERAAIRKLENITWLHDSILNIPKLDIGEFDFITCTGVLHHLADPQAGLDALKSVLKEDGSIFLMVYATYGRTGVYQMQELMRQINAQVESPEQKVLNTKKILAQLPPSNWFHPNKHSWAGDLASDAGLYDLLLHSQDRAYTVPELYEYVESSGLVLNKLYNPYNYMGDMLFEPETFIKDPELLKQVKSYSFAEQAAICEILFGQLNKQCCFMSKKEKAEPRMQDETLIPNIAIALSRVYDEITQQFLTNQPTLKINPAVTIKRTPHAAALWQAIDGERSIREIVEKVSKESPLNPDENNVLREFQMIGDMLIKTHTMYLRAPGVKGYETLSEMEAKMYPFYGEEACQKVRQAFLAKRAQNQQVPG